MTPDNKYHIDGIDLYTTFGIGVEDGSDDLLKIPERKESISHDWRDEDGLEVDTSRTFLKAREVTLKCWIISNSEAAFWDVYNKFITLLRKPGLRRLSINEHGKDYFVHYKDNNIYERFTRLRTTNRIACKFTITFIEPKPTFPAIQVFLTDDIHRLIIT